MINSVLNSIKKSLGIDAEYDAFDEDIMMHINTSFSTLHSIGASPPEAFMIFGADEEWSDFYGEIKQAMMVKTYVYIKVKMIFDPPATSFALDALKKTADELEWRLGIMEFVFNPDSRPVDAVDDQNKLRLLTQQINEIKIRVDDLDEGVDSVPNLAQIFHDELGH